jgi:hypothetical protein
VSGTAARVHTLVDAIELELVVDILLLLLQVNRTWRASAWILVRRAKRAEGRGGAGYSRLTAFPEDMMWSCGRGIKIGYQINRRGWKQWEIGASEQVSGDCGDGYLVSRGMGRTAGRQLYC